MAELPVPEGRGWSHVRHSRQQEGVWKKVNSVGRDNTDFITPYYIWKGQGILFRVHILKVGDVAKHYRKQWCKSSVTRCYATH